MGWLEEQQAKIKFAQDIDRSNKNGKARKNGYESIKRVKTLDKFKRCACSDEIHYTMAVELFRTDYPDDPIKGYNYSTEEKAELWLRFYKDEAMTKHVLLYDNEGLMRWKDSNTIINGDVFYTQTE